MAEPIDAKAAEEFFARYGDYFVRLRVYDIDNLISVEDLYQMFKARMDAERSSRQEEAG